MELKVKDRVKLPLNETGTIVKIEELLWFKKYWVRIRKSNGFNKTNQIVDFVNENDLILE